MKLRDRGRTSVGKFRIMLQEEKKRSGLKIVNAGKVRSDFES